jgi:alkanesulfonate monooxygenase SsuD/methylene tetrahydromethanopterin reductase-like flavin-dependent oxidoreductase (luciferase family)
MASNFAPIRFGALCWNQYSDWESLRDAGVRADELGYDSLWTWDHVYPIVGSHEGPMFEGWLTITAWAALTKRAHVGLMVGANTFREPSLVAKMATTLDHISGGRAYLGIGAAWFEAEHRAYGFRYGDGPPERLRWLGEALPVIRGMLHGEEPTAAGKRYHARKAMNLPAPVQRPLPLLIGGSGEQVTLKLVAQYADANNIGGTIENVRHKEAILLQHCERVGRDPAEIERTTGRGVAIIRDSAAEARGVLERTFGDNGGASTWEEQPIGTPEQVVERLAPFVEAGYRHLIFGFPHPYDAETMARLISEVKPALDRLAK